MNKFLNILVVVFSSGILASAIFYQVKKEEQERPLVIGKMIDIKLIADPTGRCTLRAPYLTTLRNNSNIVVEKLSFELMYKRREYSDNPTIEEIRTNKILRPNESSQLCLGSHTGTSIGNIYSQHPDMEMFIQNIKAFTSSQ